MIWEVYRGVRYSKEEDLDFFGVYIFVRGLIDILVDFIGFIDDLVVLFIYVILKV